MEQRGSKESTVGHSRQKPELDVRYSATATYIIISTVFSTVADSWQRGLSPFHRVIVSLSNNIDLVFVLG